MTLRTKFIGVSGSALLVLTAAVALGASPASAAPAPAADGDIVCDTWATGDKYNVRVEKSADRAFTVHFTDMNFLSAESSNASTDSFVPLPLDPNLRTSSNTVKVNPALGLSAVSISQSVVTGPSDVAPYVAIEDFNELESAPWENVSTTGNTISWTQDMDARSDANGNQVKPGDFFLPFFAIDDSAGVLKFTVEVPEDISGDVQLFGGMNVDFTSAKIARPGDYWIEGDPVSLSVPGCTISIDAGEVPETEPETKPETKPTVPGTATPPARVETAA